MTATRKDEMARIAPRRRAAAPSRTQVREASKADTATRREEEPDIAHRDGRQDISDDISVEPRSQSSAEFRKTGGRNELESPPGEEIFEDGSEITDESEEVGETLDLDAYTEDELTIRRNWFKRYTMFDDDDTEHFLLLSIHEKRNEARSIVMLIARDLRINECQHQLGLYVDIAEEIIETAEALMQHRARLTRKTVVPSWKQVGRAQMLLDLRQVEPMSPIACLGETIEELGSNLVRASVAMDHRGSHLRKRVDPYWDHNPAHGKELLNEARGFEKLCRTMQHRANTISLHWTKIVDAYFDEIIIDEIVDRTVPAKHIMS